MSGVTGKPCEEYSDTSFYSAVAESEQTNGTCAFISSI
jgi:hypothetical protein